MAASWMPEETFPDKLLDCFPNNIEDTEENFTKKLTLLALLYHVPFKYIIPSELYLKDHEIRFFHLDQSWIFAMLDGALSLGRNISFDYKWDMTVIEGVMNKAVSKSNLIRPELQGKELPESSDSSFQCTGFVMRSPLVRGWRGLEFKGYNGEEELIALRIENIKDDVILGIYAGCINRIEILEPPEGLHYGFNRDNNNKLTKNMRSFEDGTLFDKKDNLKQINLTERGNRVIDFIKCAESIQNAFPGCEKIKSSHIALQMIQNAYKIQIDEQNGG